MQNEKIKFKPLHDGVGFHPFSEGLPYAPQTTQISPKTEPHKTAPSITPDYTRGSGSMSAGTPNFSMPKTTRQIQQHITQKPIVNTQPTPPLVAPTIAPTKVPAQSLLRTRFFAYLLDTVVHLGFWISINLVAALVFHFEIDPSLLEKNWFGFVAFFIFSQWFFIAMQEVLFENSIGKSFFGLEFKRNRKSFFVSSLLIRSIVFIFGVLLAGVGFYFRPQDLVAEIQLKQS